MTKTKSASLNAVKASLVTLSIVLDKVTLSFSSIIVNVFEILSGFEVKIVVRCPLLAQ